MYSVHLHVHVRVCEKVNGTVCVHCIHVHVAAGVGTCMCGFRTGGFGERMRTLSSGGGGVGGGGGGGGGGMGDVPLQHYCPMI